MSTILNKVVPNHKVQIRIIKEGFSSPILGYPNYIGKIVTLNVSTARRFVEQGIAELVESDSQQKGGQTSDENKHMTLEDALKSLNPDDDAHWTKKGMPDLNVLTELTGTKVKAKDVGEYNRDAVRAAKTQDAENDDGGTGE